MSWNFKLLRRTALCCIAMALTFLLSVDNERAAAASVIPRYVMLPIDLTSVATKLGLPAGVTHSLIIVEQNFGVVTECSQLLSGTGAITGKCQKIGTVDAAASTVTLVTSVSGLIAYIVSPSTGRLYACNGLVNTLGDPAGNCSVVVNPVPD